MGHTKKRKQGKGSTNPTISPIHQYDQATKQVKKVIEREKLNSKKITFFKNVFDSENAQQYYHQYAQRIDKRTEGKYEHLNTLSIQSEHLKKYVDFYHDKKNALFPDKLASGHPFDTFLISAKKNVESIIASPEYQAYNKKEQEYEVQLNTVLVEMEAIEANLFSEEMARQANEIESRFVYRQ